LFASPVIGPFDPDDDREAELVSGGPSLPVEDVLLKQREKRFGRSIVASRSDPTHTVGRDPPVGASRRIE
jgi:hypothetical protein